MNLEQIKEKQLELNELLQLHLNDLESVIDRITGESVTQEEVEEESGLGLLFEIHSSQKRLERKIDKLCNLKQRLYSSTYEPNVPN